MAEIYELSSADHYLGEKEIFSHSEKGTVVVAPTVSLARGPSPIPGSISDIMIDEIKEEKKFVFKDPAFQHSSKSTNKKRAWRSLKQIVAQERVLPWPEDAVHYSSIDALPSFKPVKKYSDISGLLAKYTDPQTKLHFAVAEEFSTVRSLPMDITAGYLSLRRANNPMG